MAVTYEGSASPDLRNYRVNCDKIRRVVPAFQPRWTLRAGIEQLYEAYRQIGLTQEDFLGPRYFRIGHIKERMATGGLDERLMPRSLAA